MAGSAPAGPASERPRRVAPHSMTPNKISIYASRAAISARAGSSTIANAWIRAATCTSTTRVQCIGAPSGGASRYWRKSNQLCPAIQSRICAMRMASSVSLRRPSAQTAVICGHDSRRMTASATTPTMMEGFTSGLVEKASVIAAPRELSKERPLSSARHGAWRPSPARTPAFIIIKA